MATFFSYDSEGNLTESFHVEDDVCVNENGEFSHEVGIRILKEINRNEIDIVYADPNSKPPPIFPISKFINGEFITEGYIDVQTHDDYLIDDNGNLFDLDGNPLS